MARRRIWSETVPYEKVCAHRVTALLRRYDVGLRLAVRPPDLDQLARTVAHLEGEGIAVGLWPMLADRDGRWANARNAAIFAEFARAVMRVVPGRELLVDLEPSIGNLRDVRGGASRMRNALRRLGGNAELSMGHASFVRLGDEARARGASLTAVVVPAVLLDPPEAPRWQAFLGTPLALERAWWERIDVMLYTSILEGWSGGVLRRPDVLALLGEVARIAVERHGGRAELSLGAVGVGAFGSEPVYRSPAELARDVGIASACAVESLTLLDLGGVLAREPAEAWLEAFVHAPPETSLPALTARTRVLLAIARGVAPGLAHAARGARALGLK